MKLLYKPFGLLASVVGGIVAGALFKRLWRAVADEDKAPSAKDQDRHGVKCLPPRRFRVQCPEA